MWEFFDPYLLILFRITGVANLDWFVGTFILALLVCIIGEFTISIVFRVNRKHLDKLNNDLKKYSDLSREALGYGDEAGYKALNKQANDAYGRVFFNRFGLSAASLWPAFFALDWMQRHFAGTGFPIFFYPGEVNYVVAFLLCYILARIVFGRLKRYLPYFKGQYAMLLSYDKKDRM